MIVRASSLLQERKYRITGVSVLDVVEGACVLVLADAVLKSAHDTEFTLEALPIMHSLLDSRPEGFESPEQAIEWQ